MKKILLTLYFFSNVLFVLNAQSGTTGNLSWSIQSDGTLMITGSGPMPDYNYGSAPWYSSKQSILKVIVHDGVKSLGSNAFNSLNKVTVITLPASIERIGNSAFSSCTVLQSITIPSNSTLTNIGDYAFSSLYSVESLFLPAGVSSITRYTFLGFYANINVDVNNSNYSSVDGVLYNKDKTTILRCPPNKSGIFEIPNTVKTIGSYSFDNCHNITSLVISNSVTDIQNFAFSNAKGIYFSGLSLPASVCYIGRMAFGNNSFSKISIDNANQYFSIENGIIYDKNKEMLYMCHNTSGYTIKIPETVHTIADSAFYDCTLITNVQLPKSLYQIANRAFYHSGISTIQLPEKLKSIGYAAFDSCFSLSSVTFPASLQSVGDRAFYMAGVNSFYVSNTTPFSFGSNNVFMTNSTLYVPSGCKSIYEKAKGWSDFKNIVEPASKSIQLSFPGTLGQNTSQLERNNLTNLTITGSIDARDFKFMRDSLPVLQSLNIKNTTVAEYTGTAGTIVGSAASTKYTANSIPTYAFYRHKQIKSIELPSQTDSIMRYAFSECSNLTDFKLPSNLKKIFYNALGYCKQIKKIDIPVSVSIIEDLSFVGCKFDSISVQYNTPLILSGKAFYDIPYSTCILVVPTNTKQLYQEAVEWKNFKNIVESNSNTPVYHKIAVTLSVGGEVLQNYVNVKSGDVVEVLHNESKIFDIIPASGFEIDSVNYNGVLVNNNLSPSNSFHLPPVTADGTLRITFRKKTYHIAIKVSEMGTVDLHCIHGDTPIFSFTALTGWNIHTVIYNGDDVTASIKNNAYILPPVSKNGTLSVVFILISGVKSAVKTNVKVYANNGVISVINATIGANISIYNLSGVLLNSKIATSNLEQFNVASEAVYILKVGVETFKILQ